MHLRLRHAGVALHLLLVKVLLIIGELHALFHREEALVAYWTHQLAPARYVAVRPLCRGKKSMGRRCSERTKGGGGGG